MKTERLLSDFFLVGIGSHSIFTTLRIQDKSGSVIAGSGFGLIGHDAFYHVRFT